MRKKTLLFFFAVFLVLPAAAHAQSVEDAEAKSAAGRKAYDTGNFSEALKLFKEAFELYPSQRYLFNSAKASLRLKDSEGAVYYYERYLTFDPVADDRPRIQHEVEQLKERLRDRQLTEIRLVSNPSGAQISFEPARPSQVAKTPGSVFLEPGTYSVRFKLDGYGEKKLKIELGRASRSQKITEAVLNKSDGFGWFEITCNQRDAKVYVEGNYVGLTPLPPQTVRQGSYRIRVARSGFLTHESTVEVTAGQARQVEANLEPVQTEIEPPPKVTDPLSSGQPWKWVMLGVGCAGAATALAGSYFWYDGWAGMGRANDDKDSIGDTAYTKQYGDARGAYVAGQWATAAGAAAATGGFLALILWPEAEPLPLSVMPAAGGLSVGFHTGF